MDEAEVSCGLHNSGSENTVLSLDSVRGHAISLNIYSVREICELGASNS